MKALYELLAKVGTNPKLRAWAMEQIINLKKLKPNYKKDPTGKKSWEYKMDLNKVKDIKNPNWQMEKIAKEKAYDLKTKVVDIAKAKDKVRWNKVDKQRDKDKFYGVTGQVNTWLKKMKDEGIAWEAEIAKKDAWFNKLIKAEIKGDIRAKKILNDYFKKQDKDFADKIIPFKPKKAEGGRIGFDDGGPSQKEIDKGIAAIEKLKLSLMPESYEELIEIYKDKQKDLNIDIMESAGGLGEMLGEGGRIGMYGGSFVKWVLQQGPKVWKWMNKPGNNPYNLYKKYLKSVKDRAQAGDMKSLAPEMGALTAGGIMANRLASKKLKEGLDLSEEEKKRKWWERGPGAYYPDKAEGGRIGMMYGGDPGFAFSYGGSWADWKDNHASEMPLMDYINQKLPKARNPFSDSSYANGGPVNLNQLIQMYMEEGMSHEDAVQAAEAAQNLPWDTFNKAEGGRIGLGSGTSPKIIENRKRNLYFDLGRDDFMNMFEYLQSGLSQNDYDGKYKKGGRVGFKKGGKGGIGDLMSEMYRLFEIAPLLATPELMDLIQKVPFDKGGKVKKGGGSNMSRRSFLQLMGGLASLPVVGKYFKLGKPATDFAVKLRTRFYNDDVSYGASGMAHFDLSSLTGPLKLAASNIIKKLKIKDLKNVEPGDTKLVLKELEKKGIKGKLTGIEDEAGDVLKRAQKKGRSYFIKTYKKQPMKQNVKDHQQRNSYVVYENDPGFINWKPKAPYYKERFKSTIDEVAEMLEPGVKKAEGGIIEDDEFREFLEDRKNRDKNKFQRDFFEDFKKWKKWKKGDIMEVKDGGRIWRPKSAPKLTTTIPPERGPTPQGLTYLTGDDIVQNIG